MVVTNKVKLSLVIEVKEKQDRDPTLLELKTNVHKHKVMGFEQGGDVLSRYQGMLCVPKVDDLQRRIMTKVHSSKYSIHPGCKKMYH